ncbi:hypothetical protein GF314_09225 [bacterium]|nr:hypothetical protein [bacterium]
MRRLLVLVAILAIAPIVRSAPAPLESFDALMGALRDGHTVRVVADYSDCEMIIDNEPDVAPDAVGGMTIDAWEWFAPGAVYNERAFVVFSHASLIEHPRQGMVTNHVKFKVYEDDEVVISARYLDPVSFEVTMFEKFFGTVARGDDGAVRFHRLD